MPSFSNVGNNIEKWNLYYDKYVLCGDFNVISMSIFLLT